MPDVADIQDRGEGRDPRGLQVAQAREALAIVR